MPLHSDLVEMLNCASVGGLLAGARKPSGLPPAHSRKRIGGHPSQEHHGTSIVIGINRDDFPSWPKIGVFCWSVAVRGEVPRMVEGKHTNFKCAHLWQLACRWDLQLYNAKNQPNASLAAVIPTTRCCLNFSQNSCRRALLPITR